MQAANGGQLPGRGEIQTRDLQFGKRPPSAMPYYVINSSKQSLADQRGAQCTPPQGSQFFHFDTQNFRNVTALGVHTPPYEVHAPYTGNPGSATDNVVNIIASNACK